MKTRIENHKSYVIETEEGEEKGIFFRSPIQKVSFDAYHDTPMFSPWKYKVSIQNPIRRFYEILIGNGNIVKNINKWIEMCDFGGFDGNILTFPIYFKRKYRKLRAVSTCSDDNIYEIKSYGFESPYEICSGACDTEKTIVKLKNGKRIKIKRHQYYNYTYSHIIERVIDSGVID